MAWIQMKLVSDAKMQRFVANVPLRIEGITLAMQDCYHHIIITIIINITIVITGVGLHDYPSTVDTGSTGLAVVIPGSKPTRSTKSCETFRPCMEDVWGLLFYKCFADLTGYQLQSGFASMTLNGKTAKVSYGHARLVYDFDGSMYDGKTGKYTNILGLGSHGGKTCTASHRDLLSDYIEAAQLHKMFSLRSASSTGAGRLYIGGSEDTWKAVGTSAPLVVDEKGHYVLHLSGFDISSSGQSKTQSVKLPKSSEVILDSGASVSTVVARDVMQSWLQAFKVMCDGDWVSGQPMQVHMHGHAARFNAYKDTSPTLCMR